MDNVIGEDFSVHHYVAENNIKMDHHFYSDRDVCNQIIHIEQEIEQLHRVIELMQSQIHRFCITSIIISAVAAGLAACFATLFSSS